MVKSLSTPNQWWYCRLAMGGTVGWIMSRVVACHALGTLCMMSDYKVLKVALELRTAEA